MPTKGKDLSSLSLPEYWLLSRVWFEAGATARIAFQDGDGADVIESSSHHHNGGQTPPETHHTQSQYEIGSSTLYGPLHCCIPMQSFAHNLGNGVRVRSLQRLSTNLAMWTRDSLLRHALLRLYCPVLAGVVERLLRCCSAWDHLLPF